MILDDFRSFSGRKGQVEACRHGNPALQALFKAPVAQVDLRAAAAPSFGALVVALRVLAEASRAAWAG